MATVVPRQDIPRAYLIEAADLALYKSKHEGRDRVTVSDVNPTGPAPSGDVTGTASTGPHRVV